MFQKLLFADWPVLRLNGRTQLHIKAERCIPGKEAEQSTQYPEWGASKNPGIVTIKMLCDGLGITLIEFFDTRVFHEPEQEILSSGRFARRAFRARGAKAKTASTARRPPH